MNMSIEENKALVRRLNAVWNTGNVEDLDAVLHPMYKVFAPFRTTEGIEAITASVKRMRMAMPDMYSRIEAIVAEGDKVACYIKWGGTHKGPMMKIPPTGKTVKLEQIDMYRIEDGKVIERRVAGDRLSLLEQLGVAPPLGKK
jgi:predicted ester cyclase